MKLNIAAYYPKGTNGVSEILPLLSSGSLSVPLVSSVDVNEKKEKLWRSAGMEETSAATIRYRKSVCCFIIRSYTYCSCIWVYPQKQVVSAAISAKFDRPVDVGDAICGFCWCDCITSHWDALVLHSLSPSFVIKDGIDLVDVLGKKRIKTGSEPQWFLLSRNHEPPLLSLEVFVPLMLLHSCINVPKEQRLRFNCKG